MLIPTILLMVAAMVKRRQSPINLILLMLFTLFESYWIGTIGTVAAVRRSAQPCATQSPC